MNGHEPAYPAENDGVYCNGLTKRELIAAMAMQGYLANPDTSGETEDTYAHWSVKAADALIAELSKMSKEQIGVVVRDPDNTLYHKIKSALKSGPVFMTSPTTDFDIAYQQFDKDYRLSPAVSTKQAFRAGWVAGLNKAADEAYKAVTGFESLTEAEITKDAILAIAQQDLPK
jgi:hypothetical protein